MLGIFVKSELRKAVEKVNDIIDKNSTSQILRNVYIKFEDDKAVFIGTDANIQVQVTVEGNIQENGEVTVNCNDFYMIIKNLSDETVTLKKSDNVFEIIGEDSNFGLPTIDPEEFIFLEFPEPVGELKIAASNLHYGFKKTSTLAAQNIRTAVSPDFVSVLVERNSNLLTIGSTDTNILGVVDIPQDEIEIPEKLRFLFPLKAVKVLEKVLSDEESVTLRYTKNKVLISAGKFSYIVSLLDSDSYIDLKVLFEKEVKYEVKLNKNELDLKLKPIVHIIDAEQSCLHVQFDGEVFSVEGYNSPNKAVVKIKPIDSNKEEFDVYLNSNNLMKILNSISSEEITFQMTPDKKMVFLMPVIKSEIKEGYIIATINFEI